MHYLVYIRYLWWELATWPPSIQNILGLNFTKRDALSSVYKISMGCKDVTSSRPWGRSVMITHLIIHVMHDYSCLRVKRTEQSPKVMHIEGHIAVYNGVATFILELQLYLRLSLSRSKETVVVKM